MTKLNFSEKHINIWSIWLSAKRKRAKLCRSYQLPETELQRVFSFLTQTVEKNCDTGFKFLPLSSSMSAGMMPDLASMAAQESSTDTVPIMITTSRMRSSSAEPDIRESTSWVDGWQRNLIDPVKHLASAEPGKTSILCVHTEQLDFSVFIPTLSGKLGLEK